MFAKCSSKCLWKKAFVIFVCMYLRIMKSGNVGQVLFEVPWKRGKEKTNPSSYTYFY